VKYTPLLFEIYYTFYWYLNSPTDESVRLILRVIRQMTRFCARKCLCNVTK